jgi:NADPH:quinone reductase-like Zn-dependent oxidoreductase
MKAAVYYETGPPDVFRYEEVDEPVCARDGVVIDVKAVSIEGGDTLNRLAGEMAGKPHVVGYQCAGVISEVGPDARDRQVGESDVSGLRANNKRLTGVFLGAEVFFNPSRVRPMIQRHLDRVLAGDLQIVIDRTYPLAEAAEAHAYIESRQAFGRVLLIP